MRSRAVMVAASLLLAIGHQGVAGAAKQARCAGKDATIVGTPKKDTIEGTGAADVIVAFDGNDVIKGLGGNDVICGNDGADILIGSAGRDILVGGLRSDEFDGGPGNDDIRGGESAPPPTDPTATRTGDRLTYSRARRGVTVDLSRGTASGWGRDTLGGIENVVGSTFDDVLVGNKRANSLYGLDGNDTIRGGRSFDFVVGGKGNDHMNGSKGRDIVSYLQASTSVTIDLVSATAQGQGKDVLKSFAVVIGSAGADLILGDAHNNEIHGNAGDDILRGRKGQDVLIGGKGSDACDAEEVRSCES